MDKLNKLSKILLAIIQQSCNVLMFSHAYIFYKITSSLLPLSRVPWRGIPYTPHYLIMTWRYQFYVILFFLRILGIFHFTFKFLVLLLCTWNTMKWFSSSGDAKFHRYVVTNFRTKDKESDSKSSSQNVQFKRKHSLNNKSIE